jgi:hypothetical protein
MTADRFFDSKRIAINKATTVREAISAYCNDVPDRLRKEWERQEMKRCNCLYKGNLEKVKGHYLKKVNSDEEVYWEAQLEASPFKI